ncbi:peptidase [Sedimentitalea sp. CY04]|uniref:Peptidase n=1 Tax=Parasedimentitalea denitrificans TaxID=2211118 RepID=A0ABX0W7J9_9RHOB|nr:NlpC/P60 family protein [Sedimentitalea sp. CY04]NIZ61614.1 peptidase [Sedimentitalea sp. CY04]
MTAHGNRVVAAARGWIGTPYVHQAACKGGGCDCLGLVRGIWSELVGAEPEQVPAYSMDWSEPQGEEQLWQAALRHLVAKPLDQAAVGDVILFRMRDGAVAKHLGVQSCVGMLTQRVALELGEVQSAFPGGRSGAARPVGRARTASKFIHAYSGHGVLESPLSAPWQRRIVARFQFPEETA